MGFFDKLNKKLKNEAPPQVHITLDAANGWDLSQLLTTSPTAAMKLSAVDRCVECLSDSMSKLPLYVIDSTTKEHIANHPLIPMLKLRTNESMSASVYKKLMEANRLLRGNAYAAIVRDRVSARPAELLPLPPDYVRPRLDANGQLWYIFTNPRTGEVRKLSQHDVVHYKAYTTDGINGISVLSRATQVVATAQMTQRYEGKFFEQGAQPSGVLTVDSDIQKEGKDKIRKEWENIYGGVDNAFRIAVLDLGFKYQPVSVNNKDAQFIESKEVGIRDIARFFGVPLYKLGEGKQAYASNEQNGIEYVVSTIHPTVTQCEQEDTYKLLLNSEIMGGLEVRRNMMAELRGDTAARAAWYKTGREIGYFSVDDICDLEDTPHVPGGDTRNASLNYVPLERFEEISIARSTQPTKEGNL